MIILGFDTATPATTVALRLADGTTLRARDDPAAGDRPGHTAQLLTLARALLAQAGLGWGELERIAVGVGPGTFTGLRVGVATARGLAQSLSVEAVGVSTLRVLAEAALRDSEGQGRNVLAMIDARRGEAFAAAYGGPSRADACPGPTHDCRELACELVPPRALPPQELAAIPAQAGGGREWLAVGDGALRFREQLEAIPITVAADASLLHRVDAGVLCELAVGAPAGALETLLPDYRRRPDAEIALEEGRAAAQRVQGRKGGASFLGHKKPSENSRVAPLEAPGGDLTGFRTDPKSQASFLPGSGGGSKKTGSRR